MRYWPHLADFPLITAPRVLVHNLINIIKDGSKIVGKVGADAVIITEDTVLRQSKYRLHGKCSNDRAGLVAILRALEQIQNLDLIEDSE